MVRVWYIENEEGTHAIIGEYSACGMAFDELNGVETMSPIVTCDDCVDNIRLLRRVQTRRRTKRAPDARKSVRKKYHPNQKGLQIPRAGNAVR